MRTVDVIRFNWPMYLAGFSVVVGALAVLAAVELPSSIRVLIGAGAFLAGWWVVASTVATWLVYERSGTTAWRWLRTELDPPPARWLNVTTGFDDTTAALREVFGETTGTTVDVFDPTARHEGSTIRARRARPPHGPAVLPGAELPLPSASVDAIFFLMTAHELRADRDRGAAFAEAARVLTPEGRIVVVEHVRNLVNAVVFGPGVPHFLGRTTWLQDASAAGLRLVRDRRLTPFANGLVFRLARS